MIFTDYYGEQSCGRPISVITGTERLPHRLEQVGIGCPIGYAGRIPASPTFKPPGYATGSSANHLGDKDEHLPTMHGFDEFFGNLYHLNAEEEPELRDYPPEKDFPNFKKNFGPRGVLHCWARPNGKQKIENTGPLTKKRMETVDEEFLAAAKDFITKANKSKKPFFVWFNTTHMHFRTHAKPRSRGQSGRWQSEYHDVMIDHDKHVGELLKLLDDLKIAEDTVVMYSTDNGPHMNYWPDAGMTPFRNEKNSNWEGAYRVPAIVRWREDQSRLGSNEIVSHMDWLPTFLAAGEPDIKEKLKEGYIAGDKTFKIHLDGYNLLPYLTARKKEKPARKYFYFSDDGDLTGLRYDNWKLVFMEQRATGTLRIWAEPFVPLRVPKLLQFAHRPVRTRRHHIEYVLRLVPDHVYLLMPAQSAVGAFLQTFKEFPPRQKAASFTVDQVMEKLTQGITSA
jgi:arylsulfatase